jgi:hypothetical protein
MIRRLVGVAVQRLACSIMSQDPPRFGENRGLVSSTGCLDPPLCEGPPDPHVLFDVSPSVRVGTLGTEAATVRDLAQRVQQPPTCCL